MAPHGGFIPKERGPDRAQPGIVGAEYGTIADHQWVVPMMLSRLVEEQHLAQVEQAIKHGKQLIREQQARLEKLRHDGHPTRASELLLKNFLTTQSLMEHTRKFIKEVLKDQDEAPLDEHR